MATATSKDKLSEALKLLDEAARMKKDELKDLMDGKYGHLKETFTQTEKKVAEQFQQAVDSGRAKADEFGKNLDKEVREKPWKYIAIAAGVAYLLGLNSGRK